MKKILVLISLIFCGSIINAQSKKDLKANIIICQDKVIALESEIQLLSNKIIDLNHTNQTHQKKIEIWEKQNKKLLREKKELVLLVDSYKNQLEATVERAFGDPSNFLTDLSNNNTEVDSKDFSIRFMGAIYQNRNHDLELSKTEIYFENALDFSVQNFTNISLGESLIYTESYDCKDANRSKNIKSYLSILDDMFPSISFLKGKLITIKNRYDNISRDYLFSYSKGVKDEFGHSSLRFNLVDDDENGYTIPTIIINNQVYLYMDDQLIENLKFDIAFTTEIKLKVQRKIGLSPGGNNYFERFGWTDFEENSGSDSYFDGNDTKYPNQYRCYCDKTYIKLFKSPLVDDFVSSPILLESQDIDDDRSRYNRLFYLFELIEE